MNDSKVPTFVDHYAQAMREDNIFFASLIGGILLFVAAVILGSMWLDCVSCVSRWRASGLHSDWGPLQGCLVQQADGTWVPDSRLRYFKEDK